MIIILFAIAPQSVDVGKSLAEIVKQLDANFELGFKTLVHKRSLRDETRNM